MDNKDEYRKFCLDNLDLIRIHNLPKISNHKYTLKEAILIEFRVFPHLEFIIRNTIMKLGPTWSHTIFCGKLNFDSIINICETINNELKNKYGKSTGQIRVIKIELDNFTIGQYSLFLADHLFWDSLIGEKILIYQDDTCIFEDNIDDFLEFDYIGAQFPTNIHSGTYVGNGGLSLRSKSVMKQIINKQKILDTELDKEIMEKYEGKVIIPEDIYFCKVMYENNIGVLANIEEANKFSVEYCYNNKVYPFGGHCFWNSIKDWKNYIKERVLNKL